MIIPHKPATDNGMENLKISWIFIAVAVFCILRNKHLSRYNPNRQHNNEENINPPTAICTDASNQMTGATTHSKLNKRENIV